MAPGPLFLRYTDEGDVGGCYFSGCRWGQKRDFRRFFIAWQRSAVYIPVLANSNSSASEARTELRGVGCSGFGQLFLCEQKGFWAVTFHNTGWPLTLLYFFLSFPFTALRFKNIKDFMQLATLDRLPQVLLSSEHTFCLDISSRSLDSFHVMQNIFWRKRAHAVLMSGVCLTAVISKGSWSTHLRAEINFFQS